MQDSIKFDMPVHFAFDNAAVRSEDQPELARFAAVVKTYYPDSRVTVEGFADPSGSEAYNRALSRRRAEAVRTVLADQGLAQGQMSVVGYGETRLVNKARHDEAGAEMNRRVVFVIETAGSPITAAMLNGGQMR
jgi:peptidoglycan-associated lipoprotein